MSGKERQNTYNFRSRIDPVRKPTPLSPGPISRCYPYPTASSPSARVSQSRPAQSILPASAQTWFSPHTSSRPASEAGWLGLVLRLVWAFSGYPIEQRRFVLAVPARMKRAAQGPIEGQIMCVPSWSWRFIISTSFGWRYAAPVKCPREVRAEGPVGLVRSQKAGVSRSGLSAGDPYLELDCRIGQKLRNNNKVSKKVRWHLLVEVLPNPRERCYDEEGCENSVMRDGRGHTSVMEAVQRMTTCSLENGVEKRTIVAYASRKSRYRSDEGRRYS